MTDSQEFQNLLGKHWPDLSAESVHKIVLFREKVLQENESQNLTRLLSPRDFVFGHVLDVKALLEFKALKFPAMDLGSGVGVPGLLSALLRPDIWILAESERKKADFLQKVVEEFTLKHVRVFPGRGESFLKSERVGSIVARAVGPVDRIYGWVRNCSTWNNLVLFKGRGWKEEWISSKGLKSGRELSVSEDVEYSTWPERDPSRLVSLKRVPRGTLTR